MTTPRFTPRPENDFQEFIDTYYQRCRQRCPEIEGCAGKWKFEDLIPGLSDFDTRLLTKTGLVASDWNRISLEVGKAHLELAMEYPSWARTLEHLPGVNLMWEELFDIESYYPEFCQWTCYHGTKANLEIFSRAFRNRPWSEADAIYHWKRIALYYERYNRSIDPPINLGKFESKYPMHSRLMHYLAPPLHSAVCLMDRHTTPGKLDAFKRARELFPHRETMDLVLDCIARHYETPEWYSEPKLTEFDVLLEDYLRGAINTLLESDRSLSCPINPLPSELRSAMQNFPKPAPLSVIFENVKFARLMKGRLWFYSQEVQWFDSIPLIRIELNRIRKNFLLTPLEIFSRHLLHADLDYIGTLEALRSQGISSGEIALCKRFHFLADGGIPESEYKARARQIVDIYDEFLVILERIAQVAKNASPTVKTS
ncbi:MAG: hypothetical protein K8R88_14560 [Armatimonadetes bacterium]|nr:hypothetical protein [Armatimonadota bacterium]